MRKEIKLINDNKIWFFILLFLGYYEIFIKWVYKVKIKVNGIF